MIVSRFQSAAGADVLQIEGELDMSNLGEVERAFDAAVDGGARVVIADLSDVSFVDSSTLNFLQQARQRLQEARASLLVVRPSSTSAWHVFEVTMLDRLFRWFESLAAAERHVAADDPARARL